MNIINQREKLKELHRLGIISASHLDAALKAPVFTWNPASHRELTMEESDFVRQNIQTASGNVPTIGPFNCFRISRDKCFDVWFRFQETSQWMLIKVAYVCAERNFEHWYCNTYGWNYGDKCQYMLWIGGKKIPLGDAGMTRDDAVKVMRQCTDVLTYFLFETMLPGNTVLRIEPPYRDGKSVEWRLARTHYLILNHKQAQACQQHKKAPTAGQIERAAHWRRAHFRRLMDERFKQRGRLIPVHQAWVGPTEWSGLDGKIYKVVDVKNTAPTV